MRFVLFSFLLLTACQFHPLFGSKTTSNICVASIPEAAGYQLKQELKNYFNEEKNCQYTLKVKTPSVTMTDQSISNKDFITTQKVSSFATYTLLDNKKQVLLQNTASANASVAVVANPYSSVVATEKTTQNLIPLLAEQIALHVTAFLDRNNE